MKWLSWKKDNNEHYNIGYADGKSDAKIHTHNKSNRKSTPHDSLSSYDKGYDKGWEDNYDDSDQSYLFKDDDKTPLIRRTLTKQTHQEDSQDDSSEEIKIRKIDGIVGDVFVKQNLDSPIKKITKDNQ